MGRRNPADIKDKPFHYLTPRSFQVVKGHRQWTCECECGAFVTRREDYLVNGATTSCGCKHPRRNRGAAHPTWKGCGELNGQYFCSLKQNAEIRGHDFDVSIEYLWSLFVQQQGRCALTGVELCFQGHKDKMAGAIQTASLDRKDSSVGYVEGNVWWVHKDVNEMKKSLSLTRFLEVCRLVAERHPPAQAV